MSESTPTLSFHDGEPPQRSDRQYIALAIPYDSHDQEPPPRWCVIQWGGRWAAGRSPIGNGRCRDTRHPFAF